jgi:hypothetical protein
MTEIGRLRRRRHFSLPIRDEHVRDCLSVIGREVSDEVMDLTGG